MATESVRHPAVPLTRASYFRWVAYVIALALLAAWAPLPGKILFGYWAFAFLLPVLAWPRERYVELTESAVRVLADVRVVIPYLNIATFRRSRPGRWSWWYKRHAELVLNKPIWTFRLIPIPLPYRQCAFALAVEGFESLQSDLRRFLDPDAPRAEA